MHLLLLCITILIVTLILKLLHSILYLPLKTQRHFHRQGITGPAYRPIIGNSAEIRRIFADASSRTLPLCHDIVPRVLPFYHKWSEMYGESFLYWFGWRPRLAVVEPEMVKEVLLSSGGAFGRVEFNPLTRMLFGQGLVGLSGQAWSVHRRITTQAFNMERVKGWVPEIVASTVKMLDKWDEESGGKDEFEVEVNKELHCLTADVISRTAFGSSFEAGKAHFRTHGSANALDLLGYEEYLHSGFLPTKKNRERWRIEKETRRLIKALILTNDKFSVNSKNLLSLLMSPHKGPDGKPERLGIDEVIDECKTFYFGGKDTTGNFLSWALLMLAMHQEWQYKAREEVVRVCKSSKAPTADNLNDLKIMTLIMSETLRLYPSVVTLMRHVNKDIKLGRLDIPRNTQLFLPLTAIHHDPKIWGEDANEFNPSRFNEHNRHLASFFPFGLGPRICVGQNLAVVEAKIVLATILRQFTLEVSPTYVHAPIQFMTLRPQFGVQIRFRKTWD
ncbi:unnamed protein product [Rhodiola kirilowii]